MSRFPSGGHLASWSSAPREPGEGSLEIAPPHSPELTKDGPVSDGEVHVGTMHRFKGLEYQRLAIVGASNGILPPNWIRGLAATNPPRYQVEDRKASSGTGTINYASLAVMVYF
jgi:superfamily I DNA/RNA helicase